MANGFPDEPISVCVVSEASVPQFAILVTGGQESSLRAKYRALVANLSDSLPAHRWSYHELRELLESEGYLCAPVTFLTEP
jgi:hypothetical protein